MLLGFMVCKEALHKMDEYLDRQLSEEEMQAVKRHVKMCHACAMKFASEEERLLDETREKIEHLQTHDPAIIHTAEILKEVAKPVWERPEKASPGGKQSSVDPGSGI